MALLVLGKVSSKRLARVCVLARPRVWWEYATVDLGKELLSHPPIEPPRQPVAV